MNIFELLPRQDDSGDETSLPQKKPITTELKSGKQKVADRKDQNDPKEAGKGGKQARLKDGDFVWHRKDAPVTETKTAAVAKPAVEVNKAEPPQNSVNDANSKGKKKKTVRIVDTPGPSVPAEEGVEDIILLDQYLQEKYKDQDPQKQEVDTDLRFNGDVALTDEMKKLGLRLSVKKQQVTQKVYKRVNVGICHLG
jgi:hypothetical protein